MDEDVMMAVFVAMRTLWLQWSKKEAAVVPAVAVAVTWRDLRRDNEDVMVCSKPQERCYCGI